MPDLNRIQRLIAQPAPWTRTAVLLFRLGDLAAARGFLRWARGRVPHGAEPGAARARPLFLALSWQAIAKLAPPGLDPEAGRRAFGSDFAEETPEHPAVAPEAGFIGSSAPAHWWQERFATGDIELVVHLNLDEGDEAAGLDELRTAAVAAGLAELTLPAFPNHALQGYRPAGGILHFGFRDGITNPKIDWAGDGAAPVDFRELLLGYPSADYPQNPFHPGPWQDFARDGSYLCLAWIHQDVAAFNRMVAELAPTLPLPAGIDREEWLAARIVGRWRDGSPVLRHPDRPPPSPDHEDGFGYGTDPAGRICPLNAHIRVVMPRDDALTYPNQVRFPKGPPRLMRRGFSYGAPLAGTADDGAERGLVGLFFCARLNEQFYTVLRWIQKTGFTEGFAQGGHSENMQDALVGLGAIPGADRRLRLGPAAGEAEPAMRDVITYRGVGCFFAPNLTSLDQLAQA